MKEIPDNFSVCVGGYVTLKKKAAHLYSGKEVLFSLGFWIVNNTEGVGQVLVLPFLICQGFSWKHISLKMMNEVFIHLKIIETTESVPNRKHFSKIHRKFSYVKMETKHCWIFMRFRICDEIMLCDSSSRVEYLTFVIQ